MALKDVTAIKNMATTLEAQLARRVAEGTAWQRAGFSSVEAWLAQRSGTSPAKAKEALETAERLEDLPAVAEAAQRGELSAEQAAVIADAATANPAAQQRLLDAARVRPLGKLRDDCALVKRAADADAEATYQRLRAAAAVAVLDEHWMVLLACSGPPPPIRWPPSRRRWTSGPTNCSTRPAEPAATNPARRT